MELTHFIKFRERGKKKFYFLTPNGRGNLLRVHAAMMPKDKAINLVCELTADNPGMEFKAVPIQSKRKAS